MIATIFMLHPLSNPSANQVQMKVKDQLAAALLDIEKKLVTRVLDTSLYCHVLGSHDHLRYQGQIGCLQVVYAADMLLWDNQKMDRGMGFDIFEDH